MTLVGAAQQGNTRLQTRNSSKIPHESLPFEKVFKNQDPHERLTDLAVVPREKPHTGAAAREQPRDSPVIER